MAERTEDLTPKILKNIQASLADLRTQADNSTRVLLGAHRQTQLSVSALTDRVSSLEARMAIMEKQIEAVRDDLHATVVMESHGIRTVVETQIRELEERLEAVEASK